MDRRDAGASEAPPRQRAEIGEPLALAMRHEAASGAGVVVAMRGEHVGADFEDLRTDCGPQPGEYVRGWNAHGGNRRLEHARSEPAPARMRCGDDASLEVGKQRRKAIRGVHGADDIRSARDRAVALAKCGSSRCAR